MNSPTFRLSRVLPAALPMLALVLFLAAAQQLSAEDYWNQFRGPYGNGQAPDAKLPVEWSETKNVKWKTAIHGKAWSSPVVWKDQIWVTTAPEDGKQLSAICLERETGKILRDIVVFDIPEPAFCHPYNSYATPTPVIEEGRIYVHFGSAGTACLDTATGKTLWARQDLPCDHFRGPGSSPILYHNLLIVNFDGFDFQYVAAMDKNTGKTVWKKDRTIDYGTDNGDAKKAYSTPTVIEFDGRKQLISPAAMATIAYDPDTGEELWTVKHGGFNAAARPLFARDKVYLNTQGGFKLLAVRPDGNGDVTKTHVVWQTGRSTPTRPSQLLIGDLFFMVNDAGVTSCIDPDTGEQIWSERIEQKHSSSPIYANGKIYFCSEDGQTTVIEAGREFKLLATNQLDAGCMASPAVAGNALLIRTKTHLYSIAE